MRSRLSRFFHTASGYGWKPAEITGDHFHQFHQELDQNAILKSAHRLAQEAAKAWNNLAAINPGLPTMEFALPKKREPYTFSWDKYPESLGREVRQVIEKMGCPDIMADDHRPPLKATTLGLWEFRLRQFAAALVHRGRKHADLTRLKDLCNLAAYRDGLIFFHDRASGKENLQVIGIAQTIYTITKHHIDIDPAELAKMRIILRRLSDQRKKGMTEKNKRRLAQFDAPRLRDGLLHLPLKLAHTARTNRASGHFSKERAAAMMMTAVAIELLLFTLLRIANPCVSRPEPSCPPPSCKRRVVDPHLHPRGGDEERRRDPLRIATTDSPDARRIHRGVPARSASVQPILVAVPGDEWRG
jgi:hypothetical protein